MGIQFIHYLGLNLEKMERKNAHKMIIVKQILQLVHFIFSFLFFFFSLMNKRKMNLWHSKGVILKDNLYEIIWMNNCPTTLLKRQ